MWLSGCHAPCDGVTRVNPDLVWQERQVLPCEIVTLGPDRCVPLCRQYLWKEQESCDEYQAKLAKDVEEASVLAQREMERRRSPLV